LKEIGRARLARRQRPALMPQPAIDREPPCRDGTPG
jgi:hypothetical protein